MASLKRKAKAERDPPSTIAPPMRKVRAERALASTKTSSEGKFPFTKLPFEMQKEVFQYLLVTANDQVIRPEKLHKIDNSACFKPPIIRNWTGFGNRPLLPTPLPCYHKSLETQLLKVSHNISSVAIQVLYGCNRFHFSSASFFNKFTDAISPLGAQSLRYLAIDYPLPRSFQVASLRRLVMGTEVLDLQALELNMLNKNKDRMNLRGGQGCTKSRRWMSQRGPSESAKRFIDLLEGVKETQSVGNNEILFAINEKFDVNKSQVREQLVEAAEYVDGTRPGWSTRLPEYCKVKLTRKSK